MSLGTEGDVPLRRDARDVPQLQKERDGPQVKERDGPQVKERDGPQIMY